MSTKTLPNPGDRIRVTDTLPEDPHPPAIGATGTVRAVHTEVGQIMVDWDSPDCSLMLLLNDPYEIITNEEV